MRLASLLLLTVAACGSSDNSSAPDGPSGGSGSHVMYTPFTAHSGSLADADGSEMQIAMTDGSGTIACGLSTSQQNSLGAAGHEIIMALQPPNGFPCPTGTFTVPSNCRTDSLTWQGAVPEKCAYYREWDATGTASALVPATAGSVTVSGNEQSCSIQVTLSFSGMQWTDSFTVTNLLAPQPWCSGS